jgi:hypothetical protein
MVHFDRFSFGAIAIDGIAYEYDVLIDRGKIRRRKKKHSKKFAPPMATLLCRWKRKFPGNAGV